MSVMVDTLDQSLSDSVRLRGSQNMSDVSNKSGYHADSYVKYRIAAVRMGKCVSIQ